MPPKVKLRARQKVDIMQGDPTDNTKAHNPDRPRWRCHSLVLIACSLSFTLGWWANNRRLEGRAQEEGLRRFRELLIVADSQGIINRERLDEVVAAGKVEDNALPRN